MALFVVATPIGNPQDFSIRALETLRRADLIIGEELKVLRQIMKAAGVQGIPLEQLNEHSRPADLEHFVGEATTKTVALVSDCGTPGFCDPGADLVEACVKAGLEVRAVPGASSLMTLLSVAGRRVDQFLFYGFLPAKVDLRQRALAQLKNETRPFVLMETPYRAERFVAELKAAFGAQHCVLGLDLTAEAEVVHRGLLRDLPAVTGDHETIALVFPKN